MVFIEDKAREHAERIGKPIHYVITFKSGARFYCGKDGGIIFDGDRKMGFSGSQDWAITGFLTRWNARFRVTMADLTGPYADDYTLGHGFVCDLDHGTHRTWMNPSDRRAVKVEAVS